MELEEMIQKAISEFHSEMYGLPAIIEYKEGEVKKDADYVDCTMSIVCEYGNCRKEHSIVLSANEDEYGIEVNHPDGDLLAITKTNIMIQLYFDLALKDIDIDKYGI